MYEKTDDFSRSLASGMSRRKAFLKFLGGAGALGFLGLKKAKAGALAGYNCPPFPPTVAGCLNWAGGIYDQCIYRCGDFSFCFYDVLGYAYDECFEYCEKHKKTGSA